MPKAQAGAYSQLVASQRPSLAFWVQVSGFPYTIPVWLSGMGRGQSGRQAGLPGPGKLGSWELWRTQAGGHSISGQLRNSCILPLWWPRWVEGSPCLAGICS